MPIYVYTCSDCNYSRDLLLQSYKECPDELYCNECNSQMYRDYGAEKPTFNLVGGCWAKQGYGMSDTEALRIGMED